MGQTSSTLSPAPITTPVLGANGLVTTPWALYLQKLGVRVGGGSTDPLNEANAKIGTLQDDVDALQGSLSNLSSEVFTLSQKQEADRAAITALQAALTSDRGTWTPTFTGATVTGVVTYAGTWKSIGDELWWEVAIDAAAGTVAFASAVLTDMPVPAARPGTFAAVATSTYADHGNGVVVGSSANLPDFVLNGATAVLSGRYVR